jgi:hypothetical protein
MILFRANSGLDPAVRVNPMLYFVLKNDRKLGPFTESQLQELLSAGLISATDRAWKVEESEGTPLDQMFAGEQDPAEEELDTVHSSPIAVSQGIRPQELEAVGAGTHPAHQWDDSVVGPDIPHARGTSIPDVPTWPSERAPLNLDMEMDRLSSVDAILPLKVAVDYQERPFPSVLSDDEPEIQEAEVIADEVASVAEAAPEVEVAAECDAPVVVTPDVILEQDAAADFLVTAEFPLTPMSTSVEAKVTDVCAEDILAEVAEESAHAVAELTAAEVVVAPAPPANIDPVIDVPAVEATVVVNAVEAVVSAQAEPTLEPAPVVEPVVVPDVVQPVVPAGLEAFFTTDAPMEAAATAETASTALVPVTAEVVQPAPEAYVEEAVVEAIAVPEPVVPVAAPAVKSPGVDASFSGFQSAAALSQPVVAPAPAVASERRTAAERRAEDAEINDVCSRIEARLAERRMRSSNVRVVPTGGIAIFGGLLYAIPFVSLAVYGFAIQIATAGTFKITSSAVPYLVEAAAALLFHAYGVVVGHKLLTGDQKGRVYAERHLELRRFVLPAIWMALFFIAGPVPMALPGLPVSADAASQLALSPFQLRIFYMVVLEQIFCGAWDIYFRRSRRVAETYTSEPYN